jgi:predicted regulator of Ras-like GTPase activity (Roadblock/LC7/MglB family)
MATLKDLVARLSSRSEVEAVFVVGQDGLLIDRLGPEGTDEEAVAAMAPNILSRRAGDRGHRVWRWSGGPDRCAAGDDRRDLC